MFNSKCTGQGQLSAELSRLSRELVQEQGIPQSAVLIGALDRIATTEPFQAAGIYFVAEETGECRWLQMNQMDSQRSLMERLLDRNSQRLVHAAKGGTPVQISVDDHEGNGGSDTRVFVAVATGPIDEARSGIGYLCQRALSEDELAQLEPFSRLVGASVENARVSGLLGQPGDRSPFAQLIGLIAHELRTPLTGMRGNIQLALMSHRRGQNDRVPQRLEAAIETVDQMSGLVRKLLDVSRLERDAYPFQESVTDLRATMAAAIEATRSHGGLEELQIRLADGDPVNFLHDQSALQQCFSYLLQTVATYAGDASEITVEVSRHSEDRRIVIAYTGAGLSSSDRSALSAPLDERYERSGYDLNSDELSLELAFSRGILRRSHGNIEYGTREEPPGTQLITVTLPAEQTQPAPDSQQL